MNPALIGLTVILVGCFAVVIYFLLKMNSKSSRGGASDTFDTYSEPAPSPSTSASLDRELSESTPAPTQPNAASAQPVADEPLPSDDTPTVKEKAVAAPEPEEEPEEDRATQSAGVSENEVVRGKTIALSAFDFDKLLEERSNQKKED